MFRIISISLGRIKVHSNHVMYFPYSEIESITSVISPCDCAIPINDIPNQRIEVRYKAPNMPAHLKGKGAKQFDIVKALTVRFTPKNKPPEQTEDSVVVIAFNATVFI